MIIRCGNDREYFNTLAMLQVINLLRDRGPEYHPPLIEDTPWVTVRYANPRYL